ncbi:MAG: hypothetical protein LC725_12075, partial [Lentisphaerae bacterium]|nr:hypothetical protein [Lentisphaerota bacterium]
RIAMAADYGLRRNLWNLYARSGDRGYLEFGTRFNRYLGDWEMCHWTEGEEYRGALAFRFGNGRENAPLRWGDYNALFTLPTTYNWLLEHYFTGDEYVRDLMRMNAAAIREHWDGENLWPHGLPSLDTVITAYTMDWDEELLRLMQPVIHELVDPDASNGINDESQRFGALYKVDRKMVVLYNYYRATGDEKVRQAFLKAVDYKYRFHRMRGAFSGQAYPSFLFAIAYKWTGNPKYLCVVNDLLEQHRSGGRATIHTQMNPLFGAPMALAVIAEAEGPIEPFPVLSYDQDEEIGAIIFRKGAGRAVEMGLYLRLAQQEDEDADPQVYVDQAGAEVAIEMETEKAFRTHYESRRDMRGRHVRLTVPAQLPEGEYRLRFLNAQRVVLLDADADNVRLVETKGN